MIIGVLRWGWVEVILRVSLEVILRKLLRQKEPVSQNRGAVDPIGHHDPAGQSIGSTVPRLGQ